MVSPKLYRWGGGVHYEDPKADLKDSDIIVVVAIVWVVDHSLGRNKTACWSRWWFDNQYAHGDHDDHDDHNDHDYHDDHGGHGEPDDHDDFY